MYTACVWEMLATRGTNQMDIDKRLQVAFAYRSRQTISNFCCMTAYKFHLRTFVEGLDQICH